MNTTFFVGGRRFISSVVGRAVGLMNLCVFGSMHWMGGTLGSGTLVVARDGQTEHTRYC